MRFTDNSELTAANMAGSDILAGTDVSTATDKKFTLSGLAKWFIETYTGSTIGGSAQSVKAAVDKAIPKPTSATTGQFLVYDGSKWAAQSLSTWNGGNY